FVICDEKWILYDNVSSRKQWLDTKKKHISTPKPGLHPPNILLSVWWDMCFSTFCLTPPLSPTICTAVSETICMHLLSQNAQY
ncbi:hypothetical protein JGG64_23245, partial [Salmonella enterica subsp. enterica serovar Derby]|nr:hypothetical protein [Salmonella enterica subsp. enterica serovar Derby]